MPDETRPNLEPIEESDMNLKDKFLGGAKIEKTQESQPEKKVEDLNFPERIERKEGVMEKDETYNKILSKVAAQDPSVQDDVVKDAQAASQEIDADGKINKLVGLAEAKGVVHAVSVAKHMEDNYILDEFHDRLADELHDALVKRGLIKEI